MRSVSKLALCALFIAVVPSSLSARSDSGSAEGDLLWIEVAERAAAAPSDLPSRRFRVNLPALVDRLEQAPFASDPFAADLEVELLLPTPEGIFRRFAFVRTETLAPRTAAANPTLRTYNGRGLDAPGESAALLLGETGVSGILLGRGAAVTIDALTGEDDLVRVSRERAGPWRCLTENRDLARSLAPAAPSPSDGTTMLGVGGLRLAGERIEYRLILTATPLLARQIAEPAEPSAAATKEWLASLVMRANLYLEQEVAIHLVVDFCDPDDPVCIADPTNATCSNLSPDRCLLEYLSHASIERLKNRTDYDLAFILAGYPATLDDRGSPKVLGAGTGFTCTEDRAGGVVAGKPHDPAFLPVFLHEIGHKFLALHTFSFCNLSRGEYPVEPWSGSTLMSYAGICGNDLEPVQDKYFHAVSLVQIDAAKAALGCGLRSPQGAAPPQFTTDGTPETIEIPIKTPFALEKHATGAATIDYTWEQLDTVEPLFRSFPPNAEPKRTFPRDPSHAVLGETLAAAKREMTFRITARGGNGLHSFADVHVQVRDAGPFEVVAPTAGTTWQEGSRVTVRWSLPSASETLLCREPSVSLSTDGGVIFTPLPLASVNLSNHLAEIRVPTGRVSNLALVRVTCGAHHEFFDDSVAFRIGPAPFLITSPAAGEIRQEGRRQTVRWSVRCTQPALTLSRDDGSSFERLALVSFATSGTSADVIIPVSWSASPAARFRLACGAAPTAFADSEAFRIVPPATVTIGSVPPHYGLFQVTYGTPSGVPLCLNYGDGTVTCPISPEFCGQRLTLWVHCLAATNGGQARFRLTLGGGAEFPDHSTTTESDLLRDALIGLPIDLHCP